MRLAGIMKSRLAIQVFSDGDQFCALIGDDLQSGSAAFGESPTQALRGLVLLMEREGWNQVVGPSVHPEMEDLVILH